MERGTPGLGGDAAAENGTASPEHGGALAVGDDALGSDDDALEKGSSLRKVTMFGKDVALLRRAAAL